MPQQQSVQLRFPAGGVVRRLAYQNQSPYTCADALNVWPDDTLASRERGGRRPGLSIARGIVGVEEPEEDEEVVYESIDLLADVAYLSGGSLLYKNILIRNGTLYYDTGSVFTSVTSVVTLGSGYALQAAEAKQKLFLLADDSADRKICVYDPKTNSLALAVTTGGTIPKKCRILVSHNNRLVLSGNDDEPNNIFFSKMDDPTNFDYADEEDLTIPETDATIAIALNATDQARLGEPVRGLIPHSNQCLLIGCTNSFWVMQGDPASGGQLRNLSHDIGMHSPSAWCADEDGTVYFLSKYGMHLMPPGCGSPPTSVSQSRLPREFLAILPTARISMAYDVKNRGVHIFVTPEDGSAGQHWFVDTRLAASGDQGGNSLSFWPVSFGGNGHQPTCAYAFRNGIGLAGIGRSTVGLGCFDGSLRQYDWEASDDDGTAINAYVDFGPFPLAAPGRCGLIQEVQISLAESSAKVECAVRAGKSAERANIAVPLAKSAATRGGLNPTFYPRLSGASAFLRFSGAGRWAIEGVTIRRLDAGELRV